jgi:hypothetical protein
MNMIRTSEQVDELDNNERQHQENSNVEYQWIS